MESVYAPLLILAAILFLAVAWLRLVCFAAYLRLRRLLRSARLEEAETLFRWLLRWSPETVERAPLLAQAALDVRLLEIPLPVERTREFFLQLAQLGRKLRPRSPLFPRLEANMLRQTGKPEEGVEILKEAAHLAPDDAYDHQQRGWFYELSGYTGEAVREYRTALELLRRTGTRLHRLPTGSPGALRTSLQRTLAQVLTRQGALAEAAEQMEASLQEDPCSTEAMFTRIAAASLWERQGEPERGERLLREGLKRPSEQPELLHQALGSLLTRRGRYAEAEEELDRALEQARDPVAIRLARAELEMARNRPEAAREELEEASQQDPRNPVVLMALAGYYERLGDDARAAIYYERAAEAPPPRRQPALLYDLTWQSVREKLADCYGRLGRLDDAEKEYRRALRASHPSPSARASLGYLLLERGRRDEAEAVLEEACQAYREAMRRAPGDARLLVGMAGIHLHRGEVAEALKLLTQAVDLAPRDFFAHLGLGDAYLRQGRPDLAREAWQRALGLAGRPDLEEKVRERLARLEPAG